MGIDLESGKVNLPEAQRLTGSDIIMPYYFVGDEAFPLKSYIMGPYPGKYLGKQKLIFNYRLSQARRVIENTFGILASRWRVYQSPLLCSINTTEAIVKATICLHNFLRTEMSQLYTPTFTDTITKTGDIINEEWREIIKNDVT